MIVNKDLKEYILELDDVMQANILCAEFFEEHFYNWLPETDISYFETFDGESLHKELILDLEGLSEEDIDDEFMDEYLLLSVKDFKEDIFFNNPYLKTVRIPKVKEGKYQLDYLSYRPYELLPIDDIIVDDKNYKELSQIGYFKKEVKYPFLGDSKSIWMSINPNEIISMQKHIDFAYGRVLVLGLGLGYYPFMILNKESVKEVIIIEKDKSIINLFKKYLLAYFPHQEKIKIIIDDAFNYLNKSKNECLYDMVFADIWHDPTDGILPFIKLKEIEGRMNKPFRYWLDVSLFAMVRRCILTILVEHLENDNPRYDIANNDMDTAINIIYSKIKDLSLNTKEEVHQLLSDEKIDELLKK